MWTKINYENIRFLQLNWWVYAKSKFLGLENPIKYLSRYQTIFRTKKTTNARSPRSYARGGYFMLENSSSNNDRRCTFKLSCSNIFLSFTGCNFSISWSSSGACFSSIGENLYRVQTKHLEWNQTPEFLGRSDRGLDWTSLENIIPYRDK